MKFDNFKANELVQNLSVCKNSFGELDIRAKVVENTELENSIVKIFYSAKNSKELKNFLEKLTPKSLIFALSVFPDNNDIKSAIAEKIQIFEYFYGDNSLAS